MLNFRPFFTALFVVGMLLTAAGACARETGRWATGAPMPSIPEMGAMWAFWGTTEVQIISGQAKDPVKAWDKMVTNMQDAVDGTK